MTNAGQNKKKVTGRPACTYLLCTCITHCSVTNSVTMSLFTIYIHQVECRSQKKRIAGFTGVIFRYGQRRHQRPQQQCAHERRAGGGGGDQSLLLALASSSHADSAFRSNSCMMHAMVCACLAAIACSSMILARCTDSRNSCEHFHLHYDDIIIVIV